MDILLNPESGEVSIEIRECLVTFTAHNRALIPGPIELMLPTPQAVEELARECQEFLAAIKDVTTPRVIDHAA